MQAPNDDFDNQELPATYVNPWLSLNYSLKAVLADLKLRIREIIRLNREGFYPTPKFLSSSLSVFFWPTIISLLLILLFLQ